MRRGAVIAVGTGGLSLLVLLALLVLAPGATAPALALLVILAASAAVVGMAALRWERARRARLARSRERRPTPVAAPPREDRKRVDQLQRRLDQTRERLEQTRDRLRDTRRTMEAQQHDRAERARGRLRRLAEDGVASPGRLPERLADRVDLAATHIDAETAGYARPLLDDRAVLSELSLWSLRAASGQLLTLGYHYTAARVAAEALNRPQADETDERRLRQCQETAAMYEWRPPVTPLLERRDCFDPDGPVLHVVAKAAPRVEAGYTLRTRHITVAQQRAGLRPAIAVQVGGEGRAVPEREDEELDGVTIHRLAGPQRGTVDWDEWMEHNVRRLVELVTELRPRVLHAHTDFVQALVAQEAARYTGVPTVYEVRGFWEETGRAGSMQRFPHLDLADLEAAVGPSESWTGRRDQESRARRGADTVLTLARVMAEHIEQSDQDGRTPVLVPNAVDLELFVPTDAAELRARLGFADDDHVFGYISSIAAYEGVDVLLRAYRSVRDAAGDRRARLLIVGDGKALPAMRSLATTLGLDDVVFTGRVPHDEILPHYAAIDTFVVPRHSTPVTELVTPLKPFEAMAMRKRLVMSDVAALREIAEDSGCATVFRAGDPSALAEIMVRELSVPQDQLDHRAAREWVAANRTWARNADVTAEVYGALTAPDPAT